MDFPCPHCGAQLRPQSDWAGTRAVCKSCNRFFDIPGGDPPYSSSASAPLPAMHISAAEVRAATPLRTTAKPGVAMPRVAPPSVGPPRPAAAKPSADSLRKAELKRLIVSASAGDTDAAKRLIAPFVSPEEKLLMHGISAKFGLFPTYDFYFLTDRRIGDLEITPLTGNLNIEVCYLQKMNAFVLSQPAFPILLRLLLAAMYLLMPIGFFTLAATLTGAIGFPSALAITFGVAIAAASVALVPLAVNPAIKRMFLRFKKSGLWIQLQGTPSGILIFADRNKFELLTSITRTMSDVKRQLDKIAS